MPHDVLEGAAMLTTTITSQRFCVVPPSPGIQPIPRSIQAPPAEPCSLDEAMRLAGVVMSYPRNAEIFGEEEPAGFVYKVISGSVRTCKILSDGRRQVGGFYLPGDVFGLQFGDTHALSAEAIGDTKVLVVKRSAFNALTVGNRSITQEILALTGRELGAMQKRILLLIKSAQERVAGFLLEMAERTPASDAVELPMSRQDIADYLGLTIETVSRTLTALEAAAAIALPTSRRIVLHDRAALARLNG
jgi:CRP/FNR family transcriptional regulator, nitrogen fixation regulation protein